MDMAARIKERRLALGLTQEELASMLGLQKSAIAKYENGRVENIKRTVILKMSDILNCSPSYLMGWNEASVSHQLLITDPEEKDVVLRYRAADDLDRAIVKRMLGIEDREKEDGQEEAILVS